MPWRVFLGSMLTMFSLFIAFIFNYTILGQSLGKGALQPAATLLSIALLVLGLALIFTGLKEMESK